MGETQDRRPAERQQARTKKKRPCIFSTWSWHLHRFWISSGLAFPACVGLAIIAVVGFMLFSLLKMRREMEELRENLRVLQTDEIHGINTMGDRMLFQRNLAEVARLNGLSAANRAEGRTEEAFQMFFRLWEGVVRLGGDIEHERRELFLRNSDIRDGGERRSRHDSPTSRGDLEDEDFAELSPGEAQDGAPQTSPEPEPHGIQNENLPTGYEQDSETQLPLDPEEELQGYADRLDQEVRDLNVM